LKKKTAMIQGIKDRKDIDNTRKDKSKTRILRYMG
jgi:hypothetical protein